MMSLSDPRVILEGALLTAGRPLKVSEIRKLFNREYSRSEILAWLRELQEKWQDSAVRLAEVSGGWRFVGTVELQEYLRRLTDEKPPKYSRSFMETLAIIAYRQPVTRGDIEDIRGVVVNANVMKLMQDRGWIECVGHRDTPGRPALWATTSRFLEDFSLKSLTDLPSLPESEIPDSALGLVSASPDSAEKPQQMMLDDNGDGHGIL